MIFFEDSDRIFENENALGEQGGREKTFMFLGFWPAPLFPLFPLTP